MNEPLTAKIFADFPCLQHAFFTRDWGNGGFSGHENLDDLLAVRTRMAMRLNVATQYLLCCHQTHSPDVVTVSDIWSAQDNPYADAMVTAKTGIALGILTADCVPVLFVDPKARVIGAAHAGWRGAIGGVLENTLTAMEKLGARKSKIYAALGPCIGQNSYEVGAEFPALFLAEDSKNERFFRPSLKNDHYMFDLPGYVCEKLRRLGVIDVEASPADTCEDPARFYSHRYSTLRGEKRRGNLMSAIALME